MLQILTKSDRNILTTIHHLAKKIHSTVLLIFFRDTTLYHLIGQLHVQLPENVKGGIERHLHVGFPAMVQYYFLYHRSDNQKYIFRHVDQ